MNITTKIWIYRKELIPKPINVNDGNFYKIRFTLEQEIKSLRDKLKNYEKRGIINSISKNPKIIDYNFRKKIRQIVYSRRSLRQALKLIKKR